MKYTTQATSEGLMVSGEAFSPNQIYSLTIKKGVKGIIGGVLKEDYTTQVSFGQLEPTIAFTNNKSLYLTDKGAKNVQVKIINVAKIKITVSKIYENNLLAAAKYGYSNDYYDEYYYYNDSYVNAQLGDVVYETEIETKNLQKKNGNYLFNFDFSDKLNDFKGIYHISIRSVNDYWLQSAKFISLSDIGLIAKEGKESLVVFTNAIQSANQLSNVEISVFGINNQLVGKAVSNNNGVAEITLKKQDIAGFKPAMITAKSGTDFNYMLLNNTYVQTSRFEVDGKQSNETGLDVFAYAERDMYRPGEKINMALIVRNASWKVPGEIPVKIKMILPNGKELKTVKKILNTQGSTEAAFEIPASAITGNYYAEIYTANDLLLTTKSFLVEEFMPDRIKVTATLNKPFFKPADTTRLKINAVNYFGPPAIGRNYEVEIQMKSKDFQPKNFESYNFYIANKNTYFERVYKQGTTDMEGNAQEIMLINKQYDNMGILQVDYFATVFDETGRPVSRKASADVYTQDVFYGIGSEGYYYYATQQNIAFPIVALNKEGKPQSDVKAKVQVIKHEYKTVLSRNGDYFRYDSQKEEKLVADNIITLNSTNTKYNFIAKTAGNYEIRVYKPGASYYVSNKFYCYGYGGIDYSSFEVNTEGNIDIEIDKSQYKPGETAKLLFKAPFNGKLLVTVETNKVLGHFWLNTNNRTATASLNINTEYLPNAYITATLIKPHEETDLPLTVAHGYKSISVEETNRKINVQVFAEKQVRSNTVQKVKVKAMPNAKITLAAVDEGILAITGYKTPNPYNFFYQKRALEVLSYDIYQLLVPEVKTALRALSSTGGDGELAKRLNPLPNKRVKLVSYWSGIADANGNAEANFTFNVPQFSGQIRLMAVAHKDANFGSAETFMTVADPLVVSTALPRFLSPKDSVIMPVTISNTTAKQVTVNALVKTNGPIKVVGNASQQIKIEAKSEAMVLYKLAADAKNDVAKIIVEVNALGEKFYETTDITVRPSASLQKRFGNGAVNANQSASIKIDASAFIPSSINYELVVSKSPVASFANQLKDLIQYPYGCTEQTVSAVFPQLYFADLSELFYKNASAAKSININVQEAIRKIKMRQLYNGAISLWDDEATENWWATVYATHFLLEAKKAGFEVDKNLLDNCINYLEYRLKKKELVPYYYNRTAQKKIAPREVAYSLFVLSAASQPQINTMNYYKANPNLLSLDSKYMLAASYGLAGDKNKYKELLPSIFAGEQANTETGGSFSSAVRDEAIALYVMLAVDANNNQVPIMTKHLSEYLNTSRYLSTQEKAFCLLSLGRLAKQANETDISATIKVNGKTIAETKGEPIKINKQNLNSNQIEIVTKGNGKLYYSWHAEGISTDGSYKEEDNYIKVRKIFYDRTGRVIDASSFKQNEMIVVGITLENSFNTAIENIVITDMLPACFEIENPRTQEVPGMDWIKDNSAPTAMDIRDDRINFFVDLNKKVQKYYYVIRVVSPGVYKMGPVSADAMYAAEYHSYHGAGTIKVSK